MTPEAARTAHRRKARTYLNAAAIRIEDAVQQLADGGMIDKADAAEDTLYAVNDLIRDLTPEAVAS
jgi:hypothetical protein